MVSYKQVPPQGLINAVAVKLKETVEQPEWTPFVKTGNHKERPPVNTDWWFVRCAAILRTIAEMGPIGTNKLRVKYGGKKNRGYKKSKFVTGSGSVARKALQNLEKAGYIRHADVLGRKGRVLTPQGQQLLDKTAGDILPR